jgi:uncharacterized circularly permuted ATP-grasp superfamily protein/uncharacterized alpha-E superfamily protein
LSVVPPTRTFLMPLTPYRPDPSVHDALLAPDREVRSPWGSFGEHLARAGADGRLSRWQHHAERVLSSQGAGHAVSGGTERAFRFDPVPLVLGHREWVDLELGISQRTRLLERVLADLYGPRRLVGSVIPPAIVVGSSRYIRGAVGTVVARWLTRTAVDLAQDASGRYVVLTDHTDVPVGAGYALAYRAVSARLLADGLRSMSVIGTTPWITDVRDAIASVVGPGRGNRRTVVLASGDSPRLVDHSLLATELGYHVAEDLDLAVSGGRVVLRSLGGLEPIDGLLRCTTDGASDPLEVPGSTGGVASLLTMSRRNLIAVANPIGSGLGSHLALHAYLPQLCQELLGEELLLPSVESLWCGHDDQRSEVLDDLSPWVLHDVTSPDDEHHVASAFGDQLGEIEVEAWRARINAEPHRYVAQQKLVLGTTPVAQDGFLRPGVAALRCFAVAGPTGVSVMPGGIGRVVDPSLPVVTQSSLIGKDVWVCGPGSPSGSTRAYRVDTAHPTMPQIDLHDSITIRAAETMFWMGRNAERADSIARLVSVVLRRVEQDPWLLDVGDGTLVEVLINLLGSVGSGRLATHHSDASSDEFLRFAVVDALGHQHGSLVDAIERLVNSARSVRQFLSTLTWQVLSPLPIDVASAQATIAKHTDGGEAFGFGAGEALDRVMMSLSAFGGLVNDSLVRGPGWRFLEIGRRLERALSVLGLIELTLVELPDDAQQPAYEVLLEACESLIAYRRRYRSHVVVDTVWAALVSDRENPRSVAFQLQELHRLFGGLPDRASVAAERALVADAQRACESTIQRTDDVVAQVLSIRSVLLSIADDIPQMWFRTSEMRLRRVRTGRRS